jgi:hypothetical protein
LPLGASQPARLNEVILPRIGLPNPAAVSLLMTFVINPSQDVVVAPPTSLIQTPLFFSSGVFARL